MLEVSKTIAFNAMLSEIYGSSAGASNTSSSVHQVFPSLIKGESRDLFRQFAGLCVKSVSVYMEVAVNMHHKAAHYSVLIECETGKYLRMDRFRPPESTDANLKDDRLLWSDEPTSLLLGGFRARAWEVPPHQLLRLYFDNTVTLDQIGLGIYVVRSQPYTDAAFNCLWYSLTFISLQRWHMRDHVLNFEYDDKGAHFQLAGYLADDHFYSPKPFCIDIAFWQDCLITQCSFLVAMKESEVFRCAHLRAYGEIDFDSTKKLITYLRDQQSKLKLSRGALYGLWGRFRVYLLWNSQHGRWYNLPPSHGAVAGLAFVDRICGLGFIHRRHRGLLSEGK